MDSVAYAIGDELEPLAIWWTANGSLVDFSVAHTYTLKLALVSDPSTVVLTKTTGFTGTAGSGTKRSGAPNLTVSWAGSSSDLNSISVGGTYLCEIVAVRTADGLERTGRLQLLMSKRLGT